MNRKVRQWLCSLLMGMMIALTPYQMIDSFAATAKIAFSDPSATVGEEVSVTMKFTCTSGEALGNTDVMLAYDQNQLEFINETDNASGGAGAIRVWSGVEGKSEIVTTLRFKALQAGTSTITISSWEGYDNDGQTLTVEKEGTSTIKIAGLPTSSTDAKLQSLQISPGTLSPSFSPDTEQYTASVGLDTERLVVSGKANNDKATVTVEGDSALQEGENTVICKVTAEDGTTVKNYTILVNKVEGGAAAPEGEQPEGTTAAEPEVLAELDVSAKKIRIITRPENVEIPAGFKESSIAIGDAKVQGWTWAEDETPRYCVFYGMNESGEQDFYRYDLTEKTVQRYFQDPAGSGSVTNEEFVKIAEDYNSLLDDFKLRKWIMIGLGALSAVLAVILGAVLMAKGKERPVNYHEKEEPAPRERAVVSRGSHGKKLSKEERYMLGVEEEYEDADAFMPEMAATEETPIEVEVITSKPAPPVDDVEAAIAAKLAKEAVIAAAKQQEEPEFLDEEDEDFEFFDLEDR